MLHRTPSTSIWWPTRWNAWHRSWRAGLSSALVRYLLVLAALCALGCAYLWQASDLSQLQRRMLRLEYQASKLEEENIRLAQQSAYWNTPSYIERRAQEEGFVDAQYVVVTRLPAIVQPAPHHLTQQLAQSQGSR